MLINYIQKVVQWILKGIYLWLMLFMVTYLAFYILENFSFHFQHKDIITGLALLLQIVGSYIVVLSLKKKMILFKGYGLGKLLMDYLKKFPSWGKRKISATIAGTITGSATLNGKSRIDIDPNENFKDIIIYFKKQINDLYQKMEDNRIEILKSLRAHSDANEAFHKELNQKIEETNKRVADSSVSNIPLELFGIACIFVGTILGSLANVII